MTFHSTDTCYLQPISEYSKDDKVIDKTNGTLNNIDSFIKEASKLLNCLYLFQ